MYTECWFYTALYLFFCLWFASRIRFHFDFVFFKLLLNVFNCNSLPKLNLGSRNTHWLLSFVISVDQTSFVCVVNMSDIYMFELRACSQFVHNSAHNMQPTSCGFLCWHQCCKCRQRLHFYYNFFVRKILIFRVAEKNWNCFSFLQIQNCMQP